MLIYAYFVNICIVNIDFELDSDLKSVNLFSNSDSDCIDGLGYITGSLVITARLMEISSQFNVSS